ncbi:MAG: sodium:proton antiporter [Lachnospiraceae bacterium]|nr:sodium:proton antiporter [Lachnospiraceae bacterium]
MEHVLATLLLILFLVVFISILNERTVKISNDVALVLFSFLIAAVLKIMEVTGLMHFEGTIIGSIENMNFQEFLMDGILCFMLFSGASGVNFNRFVKNIKSISLLALLSTVLSSFIYGGIFYLLNLALGLGFSIWLCILLGCIVSPTDPIAATSILKKAGLSKNVSTVIEGESLFNDGTGVAVFVAIKNIVNDVSDLSFPVLMAKELLGAIVIALTLSFLMFKLLRATNNPMLHILISLLDVTAAYVICEELGCSGVIASVVCGIYFSRMMAKHEAWHKVVDPKEWYEDFWHIADTLFNSILFILIGFAVLNLPHHEFIILLVLAAIVINAVARFLGVGISALIIGKKKIPNRYSTKEFTTLMTWSALKGGLSLALALSTKEFLPETSYHVVLIVTSVTMYFTIVVQGLTTQKVFAMVEKWKAKRIA